VYYGNIEIRMRGFTKIFIYAVCFLFLISSIGFFNFSMGTEKCLSFRQGILENRTENDTNPPITIITLNGTMGENGWYVSDVTVILNASDDLSGVNATYYQLAGDHYWQQYFGPFVINKDTIEALSYYSVDNAGNVEERKEKGLNIDRTPPETGLQTWAVDMKIKYTVVGQDLTSGLYKVEFYLDEQLAFVDSVDPFEWISNGTGTQSCFAVAYDCAGNNLPSYSLVPAPTRVKGIIINPEFSDQCVRFYSIFTIGHNYFPQIYLFKKVIFQNDWSGTINKFYIDATFSDSPISSITE
jgi:hypothetical protein